MAYRDHWSIGWDGRDERYYIQPAYAVWSGHTLGEPLPERFRTKCEATKHKRTLGELPPKSYAVRRRIAERSRGLCLVDMELRVATGDSSALSELGAL